MKAKKVNEGIEDIFKPKSQDEILNAADKELEELMSIEDGLKILRALASGVDAFDALAILLEEVDEDTKREIITGLMNIKYGWW